MKTRRVVVFKSCELMVLLLLAALLSMSCLRAQNVEMPSPSPPGLPNSPLPAQRPNIIFILADDLGFGDLSISGNPVVKTPNIDALAKRSVICVNSYAAAPVCEPSRISIMTGKYDYRTGARMSASPRIADINQPWLPAALKAAGYTTAAVGKWHMGHFPGGMRQIGFDTWAITAPGGWTDYFNYTIFRPGLVKEPSAGRYGTDVLTDEAIKYIGQKAGGTAPFFLYLAYTAPHFPLEAPKEDQAPFQNQGLPSGTAMVYAMITHLDKDVGRVLQAVKDQGIENNTIVIFTSDNGPEFGPWQGMDQKRFNADLAGQKGDVLEGGIKVPTFLSWPAVFGLHPGPYTGLVDGIDWQPTLLAAAGASPAGPIDGESFLFKIIRNSPDDPVRFWSYNKARPTIFSNGAMRDGQWKLVRPALPDFNNWDKPADVPLPEKKPEYHLYNIVKDPHETTNLAGQDPQRTAAMIGKFEAWFRDVTKSFNDLIETSPLKMDMRAPAASPGNESGQKAGK